MRRRVWIVCVAVLAMCGAPRAARADADFEPLTNDPFTDPLFNPLGAPGAPVPKPPEPKPPQSIIFVESLFDAATASDPFPLPSATEGVASATRTCACLPDCRTWLSAEWLIGSTRGTSLVPVLTTGPASAGLLAGAVGQPATVPLFGGKPVLNDWRSGLRIEAGMWFDPDRRSGVSARIYSLFSGREQSTVRGTGTNVIRVPHFMPVGAGAAQIPVFVGFPGVITGTATASARTCFTGGDASYRRLIAGSDDTRLELLAGYRQLHLCDELGATFTATPVGINAALIPRLTGLDSIRTENDFYGPQLGLYASRAWNRLSLEGHAATALGVTVSDLDFARSRVLGIGAPGSTAPIAGALAGFGLPAALAASVNRIPLRSTVENGELAYFGVVAEGGVRLKWAPTDHLRLTSGYSFLYWNNVRRAPEMFTGGPVLRPRAVDFATHIVSAGLEMRY